MAYLTVTTQFDVVAPGDGQLSLREAIAQANSSDGLDTIRFSAAVVGQTFVLTGGQLSITDDVTIDGNNGGSAAQTTVDANHASRVLSITGGGTEVALNGATPDQARPSQQHTASGRQLHRPGRPRRHGHGHRLPGGCAGAGGRDNAGASRSAPGRAAAGRDAATNWPAGRLLATVAPQRPVGVEDGDGAMWSRLEAVH